ncbi:MAG TPA: EamA family transporter [Verrucomicrobiota bacterium]|nr:EamA family transporter [Verrucomicrobiota bacterium]
MSLKPHPLAPSPTRVIAAFAAVYLIWGSTYLAIRVGVESLPPFFMGAVRFLVAGLVMLGLLVWRGATLPTLRQWRNCAVAGTVMLVGGNGLVNWAEQRVPSSAAALFIASAPVWFAVFDWLRPGGTRPVAWIWVGVFVGLAGVLLLVWRSETIGVNGSLDTAGVLALWVATMCWASGSLFSRYTEKPGSSWMTAAAHMVTAGVGMAVISLLLGEWKGFHLGSVSARSWAALAYLIVFGAWIAFSSYVWLLEVSTPAKVSTYAYVNPVVAVFLGWLLLGETVTARMAVAAVVIVVAVVILTWPRRRAA